VRENGPDELPPKPTEAEWKHAKRHLALGAVMVADRYEVRDGALRMADGANEEARWYFPAAATGLLKETARLNVGDAKAVKMFAQRWGLLGYAQIVMASNPRVGLAYEDPLVWIAAHVAGLNTVIELNRALRRGDDAVEDELLAYSGRPTVAAIGAQLQLSRLMEERKWADAGMLLPSFVERRRDTRQLSVMYGRRYFVSAVTLLRSGGSASDLARTIILHIVNENISGVRRELRQYESGGFERVLTFDSTLSAVYWHLQELLISETVQECAECGFPFKQTHGHQRFCPPTDVERQQGKLDSRCATRARQRRLRGGK
jgi:hypothetical protein